MKHHKAAIVISVTALCAGCATNADSWRAEETPAPPAVWAAASDLRGGAPSDWVASFQDDRLAQIINEAIAHNNDIQAAAERLAAARNASRVRRADLIPTIDGQLNGSRNAIVVDPRTAAQAGGGAAGASRVYVNNFILGAQTQWELDLWGRLVDTTRAAYADAAAARADFAATRLSVAGAAAQAWFDLIEARLQRRLAERDVETQERSLRLVERRYDRGLSASLDLRLARSALATSQATLATRRQSEAEAARALEILLGRYPQAEIEAVEVLPELRPLPGAGAPVEVLARRPDLIAAENRLEAAGFRARAARKELLPRITLSASINGSGPDFGDVVDPNRLAGNLVAGLVQPLFRGGAIWFEAERQEALAKAQLHDYVSAVLTAYQEAENAVAAEELLTERESAQRVAYEEALAAEELALRQYGSGVTTIFELLDAQERRISAEGQYIASQKERLANRVRLYLAIGGEFLTTTEELYRSATAAPETQAGAGEEGAL